MNPTKSKKKTADLIIVNIGELVTMDTKYGVPRVGKKMEELGIISNAAVAISNGLISFVGTNDEISEKFDLESSKTKIIDAENNLVAPGFVDPHVHLIFAGSRENELAMKLAGKSYLEILESGGGILKTVRETRKATVEQLVENGKKILDTMMKYGTTTVEAKSGYGLTVDDEIKSLRAVQILDKQHPIELVSTFLGAHAVPPEFKDKTDDYVDLVIKEMIPKVAEDNLAEFIDVFCEKGIFTIEQTRRIILEANKHNLKTIIHIDEIVDTNGAKLAAELKAVQTGHLLQSNDEGLKAMAKEGVIATLLPGTPFCLMLKEYAPARKMIEYGIPIAIATDLNPNCWTESMPMVIVLSCYNMKLSPAEALCAATLNAACAIQRQDKIGSIEVGKQADITIFNIPNYYFLSYQFGINPVAKVIKKGNLVIEND